MQLDHMFLYDHWANREEIKRLRQIGAPQPPVRLLAHIIGAQWLWVTRVRNEKAKMAVWPELTIDQCATEIDGLRDAWRDLLRESDLHRIVEYRNSKGEAWSSSIDDILTHVILHSAHHRGQIATVVRQGGETPAYTDYIHAVRTGAI